MMEGLGYGTLFSFLLSPFFLSSSLNTSSILFFFLFLTSFVYFPALLSSSMNFLEASISFFVFSNILAVRNILLEPVISGI
jgi:hypothetical protein